jgi:Tol biopolymer transport system component
MKWLGVMALGLVCGCASTSSNAARDVVPVVVGGENTYSVPAEYHELKLSSDGKTLFFLSGERKYHRNFQLYKLDLLTQKETRITHHDGDVHSFDLHPDQTRLLYASETDELKEKTQMDQWAESHAKPSAEKTQMESRPTEIYSSYLDGSHIQRLTRRPGYDSEISIHHFGRMILFASDRDGVRGIYRLAFGADYSHRVTPPNIFSYLPSLSPDSKHVAWVRRENADAPFEIMLSGIDFHKPQPLFQLSDAPHELVWSSKSQSLLISTRIKGEEHSSIWEFNIAEGCWRHLYEKSGVDLSSPVLSPDQTVLYFVSKPSGAPASLTSVEVKGPGDCSKSVMF